VASEPGGFSAPGIWLVVLFSLIVAAAWIADAFFGLPSAVQFCERAWQGVAAVLGILVPSLVAYRSYNKHTAAKVAVAKVQAAAGSGGTIMANGAKA